MNRSFLKTWTVAAVQPSFLMQKALAGEKKTKHIHTYTTHLDDELEVVGAVYLQNH